MTKIVYSLRAFASSNFLISLRKPKIYSSYHATVVKSKNEAIPPEEFYNENQEREKELLDVANSVINSEGVRGMYSLKKSNSSWKDIYSDYLQPNAEKSNESNPSIFNNFSKSLRQTPHAELNKDLNSVQEAKLNNLFQKLLIENSDGKEQSVASSDKIAENFHITNKLPAFEQEKALDKLLRESFQDMDTVLPGSETVNEYESDLEESALLSSTSSSPSAISSMNQGGRFCPGHLQRRGKEGKLGCHKIDLDKLNHLDILTLQSFLTSDSEIMSRKYTGLCAKCQRQVAKTIKRARNFGILPHLGNYEIRDAPSTEQGKSFHSSPNGLTKTETVF